MFRNYNPSSPLKQTSESVKFYEVRFSVFIIVENENELAALNSACLKMKTSIEQVKYQGRPCYSFSYTKEMKNYLEEAVNHSEVKCIQQLLSEDGFILPNPKIEIESTIVDTKYKFIDIS